MRPGHPYKRTLSSVSADAERKVLAGIARRLPARVTPNMLTGFGVGGGVLTGVGYAMGESSPLWLVLAVLGYGVHWLGDSLDGTLARLRRIERPRFGMFIDQSADIVTTVLILVGLGLSPWIRFDVALATLAGYLLLAVLVHLRAGVTGVYDIAHDGIGPTEGRLVMVALTVAMAATSTRAMPDLSGFSPFDLALLVMVSWAGLTFAREVVRVGQILAREEPPAKGDGD